MGVLLTPLVPTGTTVTAYVALEHEFYHRNIIRLVNWCVGVTVISPSFLRTGPAVSSELSRTNLC